MSTAEILVFLEHINYAALFFQVGNERQKFGPGRDAWTATLATLTDEAHEAISQRLERASAYLTLTTVGEDE